MKLLDHTERVWQISVNPNLKSFATCSSDRTIQIIDIACGAKSILDTKSKKTIRSLSYSHNGLLLAACGFDGITRIWDNSLVELCTLEGHENEVKCVSWAPSLLSTSTYLLATCGRDKSIWLWAIESDCNSSQEVLAILQDHSQDVKSIAFHPRYSGLMASASADETIRIWADFDEDSKAIGTGDGDWISTAILKGCNGIVWQVAWINSDLLASVSEDGSLRIWAPIGSSLFSSDWQCLKQLSISFRPCYSLSIKRDKDKFLVAVGSGDNSIKILAFAADLTLTEESLLEDAHEQDINSVAWIAQDLLSASDDSFVKLWGVTF